MEYAKENLNAVLVPIEMRGDTPCKWAYFGGRIISDENTAHLLAADIWPEIYNLPKRWMANKKTRQLALKACKKPCEAMMQSRSKR